MAVGDKFYTNKEVLISTADGIQTIIVPEPSDGDDRGVLGMRSYRCAICGLSFKKKDVRMFREKPYGIPCGCSGDIASIIRSETA